MYTDTQLFCRFRFPKNIVLNVIMPMTYVDNNEFILTDHRGLPIQMLIQILIALRFMHLEIIKYVNNK